MSMAFYPSTTHHYKELAFIFLIVSSQIFEGCCWVPPKSSLLQAYQVQLPQSLLMGHMAPDSLFVMMKVLLMIYHLF